ncbi:MAG: hypothetical protein IKS99_03940 [Firmicutes bacterium]|nr:hypothetical protein [Bacillota bacterium]
MTNMIKKLAAILLAVAMIVTFVPVLAAQTAYADEIPAALDVESITVQILDSSDTIAYPGDIVRITMTITNHSDKYPPILYLKKPQTGNRAPAVRPHRIDDTDSWFVDVPINQGDESGIWSIYSIMLFSQDDSTVWYICKGGDGSPEDHYVDFSLSNYEVSGTTPDINPPTVDLTTLNTVPTCANNGDTITFSVSISDETEIGGETSIFLNDPSGETITWLKLSFNPDTGKYEYKMPVTAETAKGTWSIYCVFVTDTSGNDKYVYPTGLLTDFYINDITHAQVADIPVKVYDGTSKGLEPIVTFGNKTLSDGTDYYLSYPECEGNVAPKEVGEYKVVITGQNDYIGAIEKSFTITQASIADADVSGISNKTYTGKAITQSPVVKINGNILKSGKDYTVAYKNNTNVGTATVTFTGKGNCIGTLSKTFKINKATNPLKISPKTGTVKYSKLKKSNQSLAVTSVMKYTKNVKDKKNYKLESAKKGTKSFKKYFTINKTSGKVTVKKGLKKGTYKVKVKVKGLGNSNYKASSWKTVTFKVKVI